MKKTKAPLLMLLSAAMLIGLMNSCSKSDDNPGSNTGGTVSCTGAATSFSANVLPLMQTKCAINSGCHGAGASNSGGVLTTYAQISARKSNIKTQVSTGQMPQNGTLTAAEKATIICWIDAGAPNN